MGAIYYIRMAQGGTTTANQPRALY